MVSGLPHSLLMENSANEFEVLLCNHDVHRPVVRGSPFSTDLVFDRSSIQWQETMERRFYLLPVHTSKTFLVTPTLASNLYLILLKLLGRRYEEAFRLADTFSVDTEFSPEESWVFSCRDCTRFESACEYYQSRACPQYRTQGLSPEASSSVGAGSIIDKAQIGQVNRCTQTTNRHRDKTRLES